MPCPVSVLQRRPSAEEQKVVMSALAQQSAAWAIGMPPRTLRERNAPRNEDGTYNLRQLVEWSRKGDEDRQRELFDSDEIDDKARKLRAEADLKEMEVEERAGQLVPLAAIEANLQRLADALRGLGEDFGRATVPVSGRDAQRKINDMIDSIEWSQ